MNGSINTYSSEVDLKILEELRDPHLISRYPPLYQRRQNLLSINNDNNIITKSKRMKIIQNSTNSNNISSFDLKNKIVLPSDSTTTSEFPKRKKFKNFFKSLSTKQSKKNDTEKLRRSISKPFVQNKPEESICFNDNLFYKNSSAIKSTNSTIPGRSYHGSSEMSSIVIPPVGERIYNYEKYSSPAIHPNMRKSTNHRSTDFMKYDMMNLDANALSPVSDEDVDIKNYETFIPNISTFIPPLSSSDSNETYYSVENLNITQDTTKKIESPPTKSNTINHIVSPTYKMSSYKSQPMTLQGYQYPTIDERWIHRRSIGKMSSNTQMINPRKRLSTGLSVTSKVFVRSRNGSALKIVREHYLRNDIPCYSSSCKKCQDIIKPDANGNLPKFILSSDPAATKKGEIHYLVLDTNIVLHAIDLLENNQIFYDVIIPQIVLEEVKNRSFPIYQRLRNLVKSEDKRFIVFHNEYNESTYITRDRNETINDRNDRAIRKVASWYQEHLKDSGIKILFICNDSENKKKAEELGIDARSLPDYIEALPNADDLRDLIPSDISNTQFEEADETTFPEYYSNARIMAGIKNGTLYQGMLNISSYNYLQGEVSVPAFKKPLLIQGSKNLNRGFNSDSVIVELLPKDKWKEPSSTIIEEEAIGANDNADDGGDEDEAITTGVVSDKERILLAQEAMKVNNAKSSEKLQPTAKIVGIMRRSWRYYVGQIAPSSVNLDDNGQATKTCFVILMDKTLPKIRIKTRKAKEYLGQRIVVVVDAWPTHSRYPNGHFVRTLGDVESAEAETEALLLEHDVEYRPFSKNVLDCLPKEGDNWVVPDLKNTDDPQLKKRVDLRDKLVCSIDPPNCVDIDDALHAQRLPNGNYEVGVHIADVTHFVKANSSLDQEGASRGTSVYLVDKRIDMLPQLLGTNLCSLKPFVDRFAFSVIWEVDDDANIINVKFMKSIIKSRQAFSYENAQKRIDDVSQQDDLTNSMRILLKLSKKLKQRRIDAGALNLASPEVKVHMDSETSDPQEVEIKKLLETNSLVEEFMLFANISVARKIYESYPQTAMLRRHASPPSTNFEMLNDMLNVRKNGMSISLESSKALADSLDRCVDDKDPYFNTLIRIMSTRCMMAAEYFSSGSYGYPEFRHYGLAVDIYTHFTSPIRRYCDVVAHRQLAGAIGYENLDLSHRDKNKMEMIVKNINKRHRNAQFAGRSSIEYYVGQVMKNSESEQEGYIIKCFNNGIVVLVPKFGVEGLIKIETMGDVNSGEYDENKYELTYNDLNGNKRTVAVFDKVKVDVKSIKDEVSGKRKAQLVLK
ncbi:unnamed protein product [Candida verbasci]|uniref:Ribosomal RNA-processing protein 44 n=1 Tax=Candida verbasci TaxID=1227364 RepID=A0A9W4TT64_9ASCO|nr:unnamed protein product [Candida verbasci]